MSKDLKKNILDVIKTLREEEAKAKELGNVDMANIIAYSRVMVEEAYYKSHGAIPTTVDQVSDGPVLGFNGNLK